MKTYDKNIASLTLTYTALVVLTMMHWARADDFVNTASLSNGRYLHTMVCLPNGKVLVSGGYNNVSGILTSCQLYSTAESWSATDALDTSRYSATATLLNNGKVLIAGGITGPGTTASAELFSSGETWSAADSLNTARSSHTATLLLDGRVLVVGGQDENDAYLASAEVYDPAGDSWTITDSLSTERAQHTATLLDDGRVLVTGGYTSSGVTATAELYDPVTDTWSTTDSMDTARHYHTATLLHNGKVLVTGGLGTSSALSSTELYNPSSDLWEGNNSMGTARYVHTATVLPSGQVLIAGGQNALSSAELYSPWSGTWAATDSLNTGRSAHSATLRFDGSALIAAGLGSSSYLTSAELFTSYTAHSIEWLFPVESQSQDYLGSITDNSAGSGITYWPSRDTYLVLDNNPRQIHEFNRSVPPTLQRTITLTGFLDPEDIHWMSGNTFVIAQELHAFSGPDSIDELVVIDLPTSGTSVDISTATRRLQINTSTFTSQDNKGIEGVAYLGGNFYFTTESAPSSGTWNVWTLPNSGSGTVTPTAAFGLPSSLTSNRANDISAMATDGTHLLLLSDDGPPGATKGRLLVMTTDGRLVGDFALPDFTGGGTWDQAEGVEVFTDSGELKILLTGEKGSGIGVDFMVLSE